MQKLIDDGYDALDYRLFLLGGHYRSQLAFSYEAMDSAKNARKALVQRTLKTAERAFTEGLTRSEAQLWAQKADKNAPFTGSVRDALGKEGQKALTAFTNELEDDLATPRALGILQTTLKNKEMSARECLLFISEADKVLGLQLIKTALEQADKVQTPALGASQQNDAQKAEIEALIAERTEAKKRKDYAKADEIRSLLKEKGIVLEDTAQGTVWKRV